MAQAAAAPRLQRAAAGVVPAQQRVVARAGGFFDTNPAFQNALQTALE
jgi:hypothetical protein